MRRGVSSALIGLLLVLLALSVFGEVSVLPRGIQLTTTAFPETQPYATIALVWGIAAITCCQLILIMGVRLVTLARHETRFNAFAFRWTRGIAGCLLVLVGLIAAAMILLSVWGYSSPLSFLLGIAGLIAFIAAATLGGSRALRRPERRARLSPVR